MHMDLGYKGRIKQKHLIEQLEEIETFDSPKEELEQYQTNATIAGEMLHYISNNVQDFEYSRVVDLGCGTGILGIAATLCGAEHVTLVDVDRDAIEILKRNVDNLELNDRVEIIHIDVNNIPKSFYKKFDVVITNPPFGIRGKKAADVNFLKQAINLSTAYIYSLHKFETFDYLKKFYLKNEIKNVSGFKIAYDLPKSYKFHKKDNKVIDVLCMEADVTNIPIIKFDSY